MGALSLSITEAVLIFAGIPAAVIAVVYAAVYSTTARRTDKRYRPGRWFEFAPVWFLAAPAPLSGAPDGAASTPAITAADPLLTLPAGSEQPVAVTGHRDVGGASDTW
jgi:hypothetical protein